MLLELIMKHFFGPLISSEKSILDLPLGKGKKILSEINNSLTPQKNLQLIEKMNKYIESEYVILPLYQEVRKFYFPQHIKGLKLGRDNLEYLEIAEIVL